MNCWGSGHTYKAFIDSKKTMDVQVRHIYFEVICIWYIVFDWEPIIHSLEKIQKFQKHGVHAHIKFVLLAQSIHQSSLLNTLTSEDLPHRMSSSFEFGAHQVQTVEVKRSLPEVLCAGIVLTVYEAKSLEFNVVYLYNFFTDSSVNMFDNKSLLI